MEARWEELQKAIVDSAEEHLHRKRPKQIEEVDLIGYIGDH